MKSFYFRFLGRFRERNKSLVNALYRVLPHSHVESACRAVSDPRMLLQTIAATLKVNELALLREVSRVIGVPIIDRVAACDVSVVEKIGLTLEECRVAGAIPITAHGVLSGVVCVDPKMIRAIDLWTDATVYLSTWQRISKALAASEELVAENERIQRQQQRRRMESLAATVVRRIVDEARHFGASALEVHFDQPLRYQFLTAHGRRAQGTIDDKIRGALRELLGIHTGSDRSFKLSDVQSLTIFSRPPEDDVEIFRASWEITAPFMNSVLAQPDILVPSSPIRKTPRKVLLVEDDPGFARVVERFLERENIETCRVPSGQQALAILNEAAFVPIAIVSDVHMPVMNGFELLKRIHGDPRFAEIPVIMLTSDADRETRSRLLAVGASAFACKSDDPRVLLNRIRQLTGLEETRSAA